MNPTGSYLEIDGRPALRFVREYQHPAERVFVLLTDPDELAYWFPARVATPTWSPGATVTFSFEADGDGGTGIVLTHSRRTGSRSRGTARSCGSTSRRCATAGRG